MPAFMIFRLWLQRASLAATVCERAIFMEKGEVRFSGLTGDPLERDDIARSVFLGAKDAATTS